MGDWKFKMDSQVKMQNWGNDNDYSDENEDGDDEVDGDDEYDEDDVLTIIMMMMALMMIVETMKMAITMGMAPSIPGSKVAVGEDTLLFMLRIRDIGDGHQFPGYTSTGHFGVCKISTINAKLFGGQWTSIF